VPIRPDGDEGHGRTVDSSQPRSATRVGDCRRIELPKIPDRRGSLTAIEAVGQIPFHIRRAYWLYDVPGGVERVGHAYRTLEEFIVALSGSFDIVIDDTAGTGTVRLNRSYVGLYVPPMIWRSLTDFSTNAVCLVLASQPYSEEDYIRDHDVFVAEKRRP